MIKTKFKNLFLIKNKNFKDQRGYFKEIIRENKLKKKFPFLVMSYSKQNVVRGLHIQTKNSQGKFVTVIKGKIFDVAIDLRKNSKTFGKVYCCILSEKNTKSIFIPEGFAHGFQALEKENYVIYSCTKYREKNSEVTIDIYDKDLNIKWPIKKKIISKKDKKGITFQKYKEVYL
ncbi:dTDP-4-dehydrorhamnose 3,5-epimerase [Candidatus Pelagibacter sp.]|uniref:dTDP-4-dehydrorhamnose 3,5-epimerase n=1 Tax=Candidatus Pelagibacter sp. TaxID=2024849 RepID=UPI003F848FFB